MTLITSGSGEPDLGPILQNRKYSACMRRFEIHPMKIIRTIIALSTCALYLATASTLSAQTYASATNFQLADPNIKADSLLFWESCSLSADLDYAGTDIRYTIDGSEPVETSPILEKALVLRQSSEVKIKAFHSELQASNTVLVSCMKMPAKLPIQSVKLKTPAHTSYPGKGAASLVDGTKGSLNFREPHWSGFQGNHLELELTFEGPVQISAVTASVLSDQASWIFPSSGIAVWGAKKGHPYELIAESEIPVLDGEASSALLFPRIEFPRKEVQHLIIIVKSTDKIPEWHQGKGTPGWLFVDEIILE